MGENKIIKKFVEIFSGEIILKKRWDRYIKFVLYCFFLISIFIAWSLMVENQLAKMEKNETILEGLKIEYNQKTLEYIGLNRRTKIEQILESEHSTLHGPIIPPKRIILDKK